MCHRWAVSSYINHDGEVTSRGHMSRSYWFSGGPEETKKSESH